MIKENLVNIIEPYRIEWIKNNSEEFSSSIVVEPLNRGFGDTIGNCLRRISLSSIKGCAVIGYKLNNSTYAQSIEGIQETTEEIGLILRGLNVKIESDEVVTLKICGKKSKTVSTDDITSDFAFKVIDKIDLFNLNEEIEIDMEIYVKKHYSYLDEDDIKEYIKQENIMIIDNYFSPVKNFSYNSTPIRINNKMNHDKLQINIVTNGQITPDKVLTECIDILCNQLNNLKFTRVKSKKETCNTEKKENELVKMLCTSIQDYSDIPHKFKTKDIKILYDLVTKTSEEMHKINRIGSKSLTDLSKYLRSKKLDLNMKFSESIISKVKKFKKNNET